MVYNQEYFTTQAPGVEKLLRSPYLQSINVRLDSKQPIADIKKFLNDNGEEVSENILRTYKKLRQIAIAKNVLIESLIIPVEKDTLNIDTVEETAQVERKKLKSEIDAIDLVINKGYDTLIRLGDDAPISPKLMLEAIKLKAEVTQGLHGGLTSVGLTELKQVEETKYRLIMEHLISFIPENKRLEAVEQLPRLEESYYYSTNYYPEYLKTRSDLTQGEVNGRIAAWQVSRNFPNIIPKVEIPNMEDELNEETDT